MRRKCSVKGYQRLELLNSIDRLDIRLSSHEVDSIDWYYACLTWWKWKWTRKYMEKRNVSVKYISIDRGNHFVWHLPLDSFLCILLFDESFDYSSGNDENLHHSHRAYPIKDRVWIYLLFVHVYNRCKSLFKPRSIKPRCLNGSWIAVFFRIRR